MKYSQENPLTTLEHLESSCACLDFGRQVGRKGLKQSLPPFLFLGRDQGSGDEQHESPEVVAIACSSTCHCSVVSHHWFVGIPSFASNIGPH